MAGYNYALGMSNNAVRAYNSNIKPISKITAADLKPYAVTCAFARWLAEEKHWASYEWHHSGGTFYNEVDFYDVTDLEDLDLLELKMNFNESKKARVESQRVKGSFAEFGGTRKKPVFLREINFQGEKIGRWIYLDAGKKKLADGNHISWEAL